MKTTFLLLFMCMISMLAFAQSDSEASPSDLVTLTPATWDFGDAPVQFPAEAIFTLTNNRSNNITIYGIVASPTPPFSVLAVSGPTDCKAILPANSKCTIKVQFLADEKGQKMGTLTVTDSAPDSPQTATLKGHAIADVTLTPGSASFIALVGYSSAPQQFTLMNEQPITLHISSISATYPFSVTSDTCDGSLKAYQSCTISVVFHAYEQGTVGGTLNVITDARDGGPPPASLEGTGIICNPRLCQPPN
jgi:hypothetical protein